MILSLPPGLHQPSLMCREGNLRAAFSLHSHRLHVFLVFFLFPSLTYGRMSVWEATLWCVRITSVPVTVVRVVHIADVFYLCQCKVRVCFECLPATHGRCQDSRIGTSQMMLLKQRIHENLGKFVQIQSAIVPQWQLKIQSNDPNSLGCDWFTSRSRLCLFIWSNRMSIN